MGQPRPRATEALPGPLSRPTARLAISAEDARFAGTLFARPLVLVGGALLSRFWSPVFELAIAIVVAWHVADRFQFARRHTRSRRDAILLLARMTAPYLALAIMLASSRLAPPGWAAEAIVGAAVVAAVVWIGLVRATSKSLVATPACPRAER